MRGTKAVLRILTPEEYFAEGGTAVFRITDYVKGGYDPFNRPEETFTTTEVRTMKDFADLFEQNKKYMGHPKYTIRGVLSGTNFHYDFFDSRFVDDRKRKRKNIPEEEISWDLATYASEWILPKLFLLKEAGHTYPPSFQNPEEWDEILDKIIKAHQITVFEDVFQPWSASEQQQAQIEEERKEGMRLFGQYYHYLWD